jgi:hypothetical protein
MFPCTIDGGDTVQLNPSGDASAIGLLWIYSLLLEDGAPHISLVLREERLHYYEQSHLRAGGKEAKINTIDN